MRMRTVLLFVLLCCVSTAMAQEPAQGPTAAQIIANQLGQLAIQNANLTEQVAKLKAEIEELKKRQQGEQK
jgi:molecular chaperone GrpE (heat shock protein)